MEFKRLILVMLLISCATAYQSVLTNTSKPFNLICSGSMEPVFNCNDTLIISPMRNLSVGDIVLYQWPFNGPYFKRNTLLIHRIIAINNSGGNIYYLLKGDNNSVDDGAFIPRGRVIYKILTVIKPFK